jgi:hypothetical protein
MQKIPRMGNLEIHVDESHDLHMEWKVYPRGYLPFEPYQVQANVSIGFDPWWDG